MTTRYEAANDVRSPRIERRASITIGRWGAWRSRVGPCAGDIRKSAIGGWDERRHRTHRIACASLWDEVRASIAAEDYATVELEHDQSA